ncbi:protein serine threonine phosphatase 2C [Gymnopilus junonius]|uniref:Protein serine threonine phosphatase 2C n=1 Tax=Gymnopilus junonius TaxID=109634 RepID=A0A9P5NMV3_GYMJU|nr:protein serine threonine phosphatase 2C [Gymnopilus junonius]
MPLVKRTTDMGWPEADALWVYTSLPEPLLSSELERLSLAKFIAGTDVVTFQPCLNREYASQDRFVVEDWPLVNGTWTFRAVFDGHAGHETADYTASKLPTFLKEHIAAVLEKDKDPAPATIADTLSQAISSFDKTIGQALLDLFPDQDALAKMTDEEIKRIINDRGPNFAIVLRCVRGSTVLISLIDPTKSNLWVASLGDCAAILGGKDTSDEWKSKVLSVAHNGENTAEADKVRQEHPGELECMLDDRVLGAIAVTRAVGDFTFKLPAIYTERKVRGFIGRNVTPPYLSSVPDVQHVDLRSLGLSETFLIMCSDGLMDLDEHRLQLQDILSKEWVNIVGKHYGEKGTNLALQLLREGLGGTDLEKVSRMITVEMSFRWMDDTTVLVIRDL